MLPDSCPTHVNVRMGKPQNMDLGKYLNLVDNVVLHTSYGKVTQVIGLVIHGVGIRASIGDLCIIDTGGNTASESIPAEVVGFIGDEVLLMPLGSIHGIRPGDRLMSTNRPLSVWVGNQLLGRTVDALGNPIDGVGPLMVDDQGDDFHEVNAEKHGFQRRPIHNDPPDPFRRKRISEPLATGIRAIDGMLTCGKGQRIGIFAGSGVGKSVLLGMIARNTNADVNVIALVGERGREVRDFIEKDLGPEGLTRSVVVVATSPSLSSDNELLIEQSSVDGNVISLQMTGIGEYFTNPLSPEQMISGDSAMTDVPGTGSSVINMPGYSLTPVNTGVSQIPASNSQMLAVDGVQENVTLLDQLTAEPTIQAAVTGQPEPNNLTIQPNVVPGNNTDESIIPQAPTVTEIPGLEQQSPPGDSAVQNLLSPESNGSNNEPSSRTVTQWMETSGITDDVTGTTSAPHITPQAARAQAGTQIPQASAASVSDVAEVTVANQQLPTETRMSGAVPAERLVDHTSPALQDTPQAKEGNILHLNRTVDVQQIATGANNVENASVKISASPSTVVLNSEVKAHGNEQLLNSSDAVVRPQAEPTAVIVKNVEITGKPLPEGMPMVESAGAGVEHRPEAAREIPVPRQYVQETQIPSDQINRQQIVITEMTASENAGSKVEQKPEVVGDIAVQRQDIPQTQEQSTIAYKPRVRSDEMSRQQNVPTEVPITGNAVSETYGKVMEIEQKLGALEDIPAPQDIPETQKQSPIIYKPRVISDQMVTQQAPQAIDKAPMPNTTISSQKETPITGDAGTLGGTERAQEAWRSNTAAARPGTTTDIENGESGKRASVEYVQETAGTQNSGSDGRETPGGNTPQGAEDQLNNMINPRTPAFDGSQFLIPRMDAESIPLDLKAGTGDSMVNAEAQMTSSLSELPDRIATYVDDMNVRNGDGSISIQLEPKHLGKIKFRVSIKGNKVTAELSVNLLQTKAMIESQLPDIRRSLVQQSVEVTELSVTLENGSLESDTRHPNLFRDHGNSFRQTNSSAFYDQEEEREEFSQSDTRNNALVDLLI